MRYSYGDETITTWKASNRETRIRTSKTLPFCLKDDILESVSDLAQVRQFLAQRFVDVLSSLLRIKSVPVYVYDRPRPVTQLPDDYISQTEGMYHYDGANKPLKLEIWNRTSAKKDRVSNQVFFGDLIHEFMHHYDVCKLLFETTPHTKGFFKRIDDLDRRLTRPKNMV